MDPSLIMEQYKLLCEQTFGKGIKEEIPDIASIENDPALIMKHYQRLCEESIAQTIKQEMPDCDDASENLLECGIEMKVKDEVKHEDSQDHVLPESKNNIVANILQDVLRVEFKEEAPDKEFGDFLEKISSDEKNCVESVINQSSTSDKQTPRDEQEYFGEMKYSSELRKEVEEIQEI